WPAEAKAIKRLLWRSLSRERLQRRRPDNKNGDTGDGERCAICNISRCAKLKPRPARNLTERAFAAPFLVREVTKERKAGENEQIHQRRRSSIRKQHSIASHYNPHMTGVNT